MIFLPTIFQARDLSLSSVSTNTEIDPPFEDISPTSNSIVTEYQEEHLDVYRSIYTACYNKYNLRVQISVLLHLGLSLFIPTLTIFGYLYNALLLSCVNFTIFVCYILFQYEECKSHSLDILHQIDYIEKHTDILYVIPHINAKHRQFRDVFLKQHETFYCHLQRVLAEDIASHMIFKSILKRFQSEIDILLATSHRSHIQFTYNTNSKF